MFGYITCNRSALSKEEIERYQGIYCGLCKSLKKEFGQIERLCLSYDMAFLILFLSALYEPEEIKTEFRCGVHPFGRRTAIETPFTEYAANLTIALSYYKCLDDWNDEHNRASYSYAKLLKEKFSQVKEKYPRQCMAIAANIRELNRIEKDVTSLPDDAINCSGRMLSELFVYKDDFWSGSLRTIGYEIGKFVYLMDAVMDYKKDQKKQNYNPLDKMKKRPEEMEQILTMTIGKATEEFEKLPIVKDIHLIRNILYGGVWQQYYLKIAGKESPHD